MYTIENNIIKLTRGDTLLLDLEVTNEAGEIVELGVDDVISFTLKRRLTDEIPIFQKFGKNISIEHEDTKDLSFGEYFYDVQITFANGMVSTIIAPEQGLNQPQPNFVLTAEVNWE